MKSAYFRLAAVLSASAALLPLSHAQSTDPTPLQAIVVNGSGIEQRRFDMPAADADASVDAFHASSPLINLSELTAVVPGVLVRERQNYAQDLQVSVRGFGTRSTFGIRGVRVLVDGIPATMPDGQGQAAAVNLMSARRIDILRGPVAQLYGNAAGGVIRIETREPPGKAADAFATASLGAGSDHQRQLGASAGIGNDVIGGLVDVSHYATDGYREHSAAERTQFNAKLVAHPSLATKITGVLNIFSQPLAQDPLGLTRADLDRQPRQAIPEATLFDTRKKVEQRQAGLLAEHRLSSSDTLNARLYGGTRTVYQTLGFGGAAATSSGGVVDLARRYSGTGLSWTHQGQLNAMPFRATVGLEADNLHETRRGYVNDAGNSGALRRYEDDAVNNADLFAQVDWMLTPQWQAIAGIRASRVHFDIDDHYITAASPNDSGNATFRNASPVAGLTWHASEHLNIYSNIGTGFETPTLAEIAYRAGASGPNLSLRASKNVQAEIGMKARIDSRQTIEAALFEARSRDEIVPSTVDNGRAIFQNADQVRRRGAEIAWQAAWRNIRTRLAYTWMDARFRQPFVNGQNVIPAGNRLPGVPEHALFMEAEYRPMARLAAGAEMRAESRMPADDLNSTTAPGYAVLNLKASYEWSTRASKMLVYARIDNVLDRNYAGSVIVNESNRRFFEPAAGRRIFIGLRSLL